MSELISSHYDDKYFERQSRGGEFGGWANQTKFVQYIEPSNVVLDFGCGGGYLLNNIKCKQRLGVEINPAAIEVARKNGVEVFESVNAVPDNFVDVIISDNALEHTLQPLVELKSLHKKLKSGGIIVFVVPCESISRRFIINDIDHHLYSWSPICIGNLFTEAGFSIIESKAYIHKWPPKYKLIARLTGRKLFEIICRVYGHMERSWFQVRVVANKKPE